MDRDAWVRYRSSTRFPSLVPSYPLLSSAFPQTEFAEEPRQQPNLKVLTTVNTFSFKRMHGLDLRL